MNFKIAALLAALFAGTALPAAAAEFDFGRATHANQVAAVICSGTVAQCRACPGNGNNWIRRGNAGVSTESAVYRIEPARPAAIIAALRRDPQYEAFSVGRYRHLSPQRAGLGQLKCGTTWVNAEVQPAGTALPAGPQGFVVLIAAASPPENVTVRVEPAPARRRRVATGDRTDRVTTGDTGTPRLTTGVTDTSRLSTGVTGTSRLSTGVTDTSRSSTDATGDLPPISTGQNCRQPNSTLDHCNTLDHRLMFEVPMTEAQFNDLHPDVRESARSNEATLEREKHWLTFAQHQAYVSANCVNTRSVACRDAVLAARRHFLANMRDGAYPDARTPTKTYKAAYGNVYPLAPNGERGDARAETIFGVLRGLKSLGRYGSNGRGQEVALLRGEVEALRAVATAVGATGKTGPELLAQYVAEMRALEPAETALGAGAVDHVARHIITERYRQHVPEAARYQNGRANEAGLPLADVDGPPRDLTADERTALERNPELFDRYTRAWARGSNATDAAKRDVANEARAWLRTHPTPAQFNALSPGEKERICRDVWNRENASTTGGPAVAVDGANNQLIAAAPGGTATADGIMEGNTGATTVSPVIGTQRVTTTAPRAYQWPAEIAAECRRIVASPERTPTDPGPRVGPPTPGGSANLTVGTPTETEPAAGASKKSWNALLNGAKGAILGGVVGFVLGGPLGMLIGAAIFGGAAWGMTKVDNA